MHNVQFEPPRLKHREDRGVVIERTYQLNVGGNMDFMNMLERERLESKKDLEDTVGYLADRQRNRRA